MCNFSTCNIILCVIDIDKLSSRVLKCRSWIGRRRRHWVTRTRAPTADLTTTQTHLFTTNLSWHTAERHDTTHTNKRPTRANGSRDDRILRNRRNTRGRCEVRMRMIQVSDLDRAHFRRTHQLLRTPWWHLMTSRSRITGGRRRATRTPPSSHRRVHLFSTSSPSGRTGGRKRKRMIVTTRRLDTCSEENTVCLSSASVRCMIGNRDRVWPSTLTTQTFQVSSLLLLKN